MYLYKFSPRPWLIETGMVRFSQPAINDPYDSLPDILLNQYSKEDYENARRSHSRLDCLSNLDDKDLEFYLRPWPNVRMDENRTPGLWRGGIEEPRLSSDPITTIAEYDRLAAERAIKLIRALHEKIVVFFLTENYSEQMWAYYASQNRDGVATKFNKNHPYFINFRKINYSNEPIYVSVNSGVFRIGGCCIKKDAILNGNIDINDLPQSLFFQKKIGWAHEEEWRGLRLSAEAHKTDGLDQRGVPVHLFTVDPDAMHSIVFDYNAVCSDMWMDEFRSKSEFSKVQVWQRVQLDTGRIEERRRI